MGRLAREGCREGQAKLATLLSYTAYGVPVVLVVVVLRVDVLIVAVQVQVVRVVTIVRRRRPVVPVRTLIVRTGAVAVATERDFLTRMVALLGVPRLADEPGEVEPARTRSYWLRGTGMVSSFLETAGRRPIGFGRGFLVSFRPF